MAVVLLVAVFTVHLPYGFSSIKLQTVTQAGAQFGQPGYETALLYLAALAALVLGGSGRFAQDPEDPRFVLPLNVGLPSERSGCPAPRPARSLLSLQTPPARRVSVGNCLPATY
jgi:hypothetical protein